MECQIRETLFMQGTEHLMVSPYPVMILSDQVSPKCTRTQIELHMHMHIAIFEKE